MIKIIAVIGLILCLIIVVPLMIFLPTLGVGRFMLASLKEKDKMSLIIVSAISTLWAFMVYSIYPSIGAQLILCGIMLMLFSCHFAFKGLRDQGGSKEKNIFDKKVEFLYLMISEPWKSKHHWGTILQSSLIIYAVILQIIE